MPIIRLLYALAAIVALFPLPSLAKPLTQSGMPAHVRTMIFGEIHGTREIPQAFGHFVGQLAKGRQRLAVGIELPPEALELQCGRETGLPPYWQKSEQDGRTSAAMYDLVCRLKTLAARRSITLFAMAPPAGSDPPSGDPYYPAVHAQLDADAAPLVILVGNYHARRAPGSLAQMLLDDGIAVQTLTASGSGTAWTCRGLDQCGAAPINARFCDREGQIVEIVSGEDAKLRPDARWDGCFVMPSFTASLPKAPAGGP